MRQPPRTLGRSLVGAWVLLASLLFGQLGLGPSLLAAFAGGGDDCCKRACPCEEAAGRAEAAHHDHGEARRDHDDDGCPDDAPGAPCPPGCDDCTCCPGALAAVMPGLAPRHALPTGAALTRAPPDDSAPGVPGRIFRPPEPSLG